MSGVKEQQSEISDRVISIIEADVHGFHGLHKQDSVAFHGGHPLVRMTAGSVRIGTGFTLHAAGRESQNFAELLSETVAKLQSQVLMLLPGLETGLKFRLSSTWAMVAKRKALENFSHFLIQLSMEPMAGGQAQEWP